MARTRSEKWLMWAPILIVVVGGIFSTGAFYQVVQAQETKIAENKKEIADMKAVQSEQHAIQTAQAAQMKILMDLLKKNLGE